MLVTRIFRSQSYKNKLSPLIKSVIRKEIVNLFIHNFTRFYLMFEGDILFIILFVLKCIHT